MIVLVAVLVLEGAKHLGDARTDQRRMLSHEKLDVYQRAIAFLAAALRIAEGLLARIVEMLSRKSRPERFEDGDEDEDEDEDGGTT